MDLIIRNGTIFNAHDTKKADIGISDGKIVQIGSDLGSADEIIDADGMYILPGGVEPHAHFSVPFYGTVSCDDYTSGTRAAAFGGTTTVIDFATQEKGHGLIETSESRKKMAEGRTYIDYSFPMIVTDYSERILYEIPLLVREGIPSIKAYMVYKKEGLMMNDAQIFKLLQAVKSCGAVLSVHAENPDIIDLLTDEFLAAGETDAWHHYLSRPEFVASEATKRVIHWAKEVKAPLYIVHVSDKESMEAIIQAKREGYEIYAETCPHYLEFTSDVYKRPDGRRFICSPPMKGQESMDALWEAVKDGMISTIGSDHCPFLAKEKDMAVPFPMTPNGCMGIETRYPYMLSEALKGKISVNRAVELCAAGPASIFGCRKKGSIETGKDADVVIFDPRDAHILSGEDNHSAVDYSIWDGYECHGRIRETICRGKSIVKDSQLVGKIGWGEFIPRSRQANNDKS